MNRSTIVDHIYFRNFYLTHVILSRFLGLCSFVAISKETKPALAMSFAVMFVTTMSSCITWFIYAYLLIPFNLTYLRTISFIWLSLPLCSSWRWWSER